MTATTCPRLSYHSRVTAQDVARTLRKRDDDPAWVAVRAGDPLARSEESRAMTKTPTPFRWTEHAMEVEPVSEAQDLRAEEELSEVVEAFARLLHTLGWPVSVRLDDGEGHLFPPGAVLDALIARYRAEGGDEDEEDWRASIADVLGIDPWEKRP